MSHKHSEQKTQTVQHKEVSVTKAHASFTEGPLPSPEALGHYEAIYPGIAERILKMAEQEMNERHRNQRELIEIERQSLQSSNQNIIRGQILAFLSVVVVTGLCAYFASLGDISAASSTATWTIVSIAGVFISGQVIFRKFMEQ